MKLKLNEKVDNLNFIRKHTQIKVVLDNMAYLLEKGFGPTIC